MTNDKAWRGAEMSLRSLCAGAQVACLRRRATALHALRKFHAVEVGHSQPPAKAKRPDLPSPSPFLILTLPQPPSCITLPAPQPSDPMARLVALSAYLPLTGDRNIARVGDSELLAAWPCPEDLHLTPLALPGPSGQQVSDSLIVRSLRNLQSCRSSPGHSSWATEKRRCRRAEDQPLHLGISPRPTLHGEGLATACLAISKDAHWIAIQG